MLWFILLTIMILTFGGWGFINGCLYRKPLYLSILGLGLVLCSGFFVYALGNVASTHVVPSLLLDLDFSIKLIEYSLAATGGGLIASGITLQAQHLAREEKVTADRNIQYAQETLQSVRKADAELWKIAAMLSQEEFLEHMSMIRRAYLHSHEELLKALREAKSVEI